LAELVQKLEVVGSGGTVHEGSDFPNFSEGRQVFEANILLARFVDEWRVGSLGKERSQMIYGADEIVKR
jgi:hypothetical protein